MQAVKLQTRLLQLSLFSKELSPLLASYFILYFACLDDCSSKFFQLIFDGRLMVNSSNLYFTTARYFQLYDDIYFSGNTVVNNSFL